MRIIPVWTAESGWQAPPCQKVGPVFLAQNNAWNRQQAPTAILQNNFQKPYAILYVVVTLHVGIVRCSVCVPYQCLFSCFHNRKYCCWSQP